MTNWSSPRGTGVVTVDEAPMHARTWNEVVELTWTGGVVTKVTEIAPDTTTASSTLSYTAGQLTGITPFS